MAKKLDPKVAEKVMLKAGLKPLYTSVADNNGNKTQKFYVRSGNSSQEVALNEITEFITKRFDK